MRVSSPRSRRSGSTTWRTRTGASRTNKPSRWFASSPQHIKPFMQKNMTQLLASYRDDRIDYGYFVAFSKVIQHLQLFEAIIEREVGLKQRRITKQEFIDAPIVAPLAACGEQRQGTHHRHDHPAPVRHPLGCDQHEQRWLRRSLRPCHQLSVPRHDEGHQRGTDEDMMNPEAQRRRQRRKSGSSNRRRLEPSVRARRKVVLRRRH